MLTYVTCDYPLPIPEGLNKDLLVDDWSKVEFHTFSFDFHSFQARAQAEEPSSVSVYSIESDGQLYKELSSLEYAPGDSGEIRVKEKSGGIEKCDFSGEIRFGNIFTPEDGQEDYFLEFIALFWKGDLKELKLEKWSKHGNVERKDAENKLKKLIAESVERKKRWHFPIVEFYKRCMRGFFSFLYYTFSKLEDFLT